MASMLPNLFALIELMNARRRLEQDDTRIDQAGKANYTQNLTTAADRIRAAPVESREAMIQLYGTELGLDIDQLRAMALGTPESIETLRAKKAGAGAASVNDDAVASVAFTGALPGAIEEDALLQRFLSGEGAEGAQNDGPAGAGTTSNMFRQYMSRRFTGMTPGQAAQDEVLASTDPTDLRRMQDIRADLLLGATGNEGARQANAQLGLGYANLGFQRDRFAHEQEVDFTDLALREKLGMLSAGSGGRGGSSPDRMAAVRNILEAQGGLSAGFNTPAGQRAFSAAMYNSFLELGYSPEQAAALAGVKDPSQLQPGGLDATMRKLR